MESKGENTVFEHVSRGVRVEHQFLGDTTGSGEHELISMAQCKFQFERLRPLAQLVLLNFIAENGYAHILRPATFQKNSTLKAQFAGGPFGPIYCREETCGAAEGKEEEQAEESLTGHNDQVLLFG